MLLSMSLLLACSLPPEETVPEPEYTWDCETVECLNADEVRAYDGKVECSWDCVQTDEPGDPFQSLKIVFARQTWDGCWGYFYDVRSEDQCW